MYFRGSLIKMVLLWPTKATCPWTKPLDIGGLCFVLHMAIKIPLEAACHPPQVSSLHSVSHRNLRLHPGHPTGQLPPRTSLSSVGETCHLYRKIGAAFFGSFTHTSNKMLVSHYWDTMPLSTNKKNLLDSLAMSWIRDRQSCTVECRSMMMPRDSVPWPAIRNCRLNCKKAPELSDHFWLQETITVLLSYANGYLTTITSPPPCPVGWISEQN